MKSYLAAFGAALAMCLGAAPGHASTITEYFRFLDSSNTVVARGSFSYDSSFSGQLTYADLSAFSIRFPQVSVSYNLAFANTAARYQYFGFNTVSQTWVPTTLVDVDFGTYDSILSATNNDLSAGFFFDPLPGMGGDGGIGEYSTSYGAFTGWVATRSTVAAATPIPSAVPLFATALGALGLVVLRRKVRATA